MKPQQIIALAVLAFSAHAVQAHPHLFIQAGYELDLGEEGLRGFWVEWEFDQYFTGSIMMDYDRNGDREFDEAETEQVRENAFSNLQNFDYFTFIGSSSGHRGVQSVEDFSVRFERSTLIYRFYVAHPIEAQNLEGLTLAAYDPTYFCAISYAEDSPVVVSGGSDWSIRARSKTNRAVQIEYMAGDTKPATTSIEELVIAFERR